MRSLFIALSLTFAAACDSPADHARDMHDEIVYFRDHRTGLCFAYWKLHSDARSGVMSHVPCTEEVERMLVNGAEVGR